MSGALDMLRALRGIHAVMLDYLIDEDVDGALVLMREILELTDEREVVAVRMTSLRDGKSLADDDWLAWQYTPGSFQAIRRDMQEFAAERLGPSVDLGPSTLLGALLDACARSTVAQLEIHQATMNNLTLAIDAEQNVANVDFGMRYPNHEWEDQMHITQTLEIT